jgi:drug/metabolite transporter (DMT)-like permease
VSPLVLALVLGAAVLNAAWNALLKSAPDRLTALALVNLGATILVTPAVVLLPAPNPESWPYLGASLVINLLAFACLLLSYRFGDLSFVYPVSRGTSPFIVTIVAWLVADEALSPLGMLGIAILSGSILSLAVAGRGNPKALGFALLTGVFIAGFTLSDGLGVRASGAPISYIAWLFLLNSPVLVLYAAWRQRGAFFGSVAKVWRRSALASVFFIVNYGVVVWAMSFTPMAFVAALRETSVVFAALLGARMLHEPFGGRRLAAAFGVCAGAALLQLTRAA